MTGALTGSVARLDRTLTVPVRALTGPVALALLSWTPQSKPWRPGRRRHLDKRGTHTHKQGASMRLLSRMSVPVALLAVAMAGPAVASAHGGPNWNRGPRARVPRRQHRRDEHDRWVRPLTRTAHSPLSPARRSGWRRRSCGHRLAGRRQVRRPRPVSARRRRGQQPDLGAAASVGTARSRRFPAARSHRAESSRTASPSITTSCTSRTSARPTTPASS